MSSTSRPLRADARANRARVVEAALRVFARRGGDASFTDIAKEAGVGVGTVYRHFPTREDLIDAAYADEIRSLTDAVPQLLRQMEPRQALRRWMDLFAAYLGVKSNLIASGGSSAFASGTHAHSREQNIAAVAMILDARDDATPKLTAEELLLLTGGIILTTDSPDLVTQRARMLDFLAESVWTTSRA